MLYDLLLSLLNKEISTIKPAKEQDEMLDVIEALKNFMSERKSNTQSIKEAKTKTRIKHFLIRKKML